MFFEKNRGVEVGLLGISRYLAWTKAEIRPWSANEWGIDEFLNSPDVVGEGQGHGRGPSVQGLMQVTKVIISAPPFDMPP